MARQLRLHRLYFTFSAEKKSLVFEMRTIICGGREYFLTQEDFDFLDSTSDQITEVISGGAKGADRGGEIWATKRNKPLKIIQAEWKRLGLSAGYMRNVEMARVADAVVAFPGGRGTTSMLKIAKTFKLKVTIRHVDQVQKTQRRDQEASRIRCANHEDLRGT